MATSISAKIRDDDSPPWNDICVCSLTRHRTIRRDAVARAPEVAGNDQADSSTTHSRPTLDRRNAMSLKHTLTVSIAAAALGLAGPAPAETQSDITAETASTIASEVQVGAEASQEAANAAVETATAVNAAQAVGEASAKEAEAADVAAEEASLMASDMIEAKEVTEAAATEAKTDAVLDDSKEMIQGD
jgi:hypothetical protein